MSSSVAAAILVVARAVAQRFALPAPSVDAIMMATGATRSPAYELATRLVALLPTLARKPGRPEKSATTTASEHAALTLATLDFVMRHPGCVDRGRRQRYAKSFRCFVLDLCVKHADVEVEAIATAVSVPLGTLKDWLRVPLATTTTSAAIVEESDVVDEPDDADHANSDVDMPRIQSVIAAWRNWCGSFIDFCGHVDRNLHIHFGRDLIRRILAVEGLRRTVRRGVDRSDAIATRGSFKTHFPGAQWVGDGMQVPVVFGGERFVFNVELNVDAHTAAFVGVSIRDEEDSAAVVDAFEAGVFTTGASPLGLLLDNRPSNHTRDVDAALGSTIRIRATPERPQNKAHVEGAFGLFSQALSPLVFDIGGSVRDQARRFLGLVVDVWTKTTNHRPRLGRGGASRVDLYRDGVPSDEKIADARRDLRALAEQQEQARRTLEARRRPEVLTYLDDAFSRLALLDPERHLRIAIAGYPKTAIVDGVGIFDAKRRAETLPDGVDARYLLGIVKNVTAKTEGEILAETLWDERVRARDIFLAPLRAERDALRAGHPAEEVVKTSADRALATTSNLERTLWLETIVDVLREQADDARRPLFLIAARRIEAAFGAAPAARHDAVRFVADRILPVE